MTDTCSFSIDFPLLRSTSGKYQAISSPLLSIATQVILGSPQGIQALVPPDYESGVPSGPQHGRDEE